MKKEKRELPKDIGLLTRHGSKIEHSIESSGDRALRGLRGRALLTEIIPEGLRSRVTSLADPDESYNCIGFVFGSGRAFIEPRCVDLILHDDGYILSENDVKPGDVAVYRDDCDNSVTHVGIVANTSTEHGIVLPDIISKWGCDNLMLHPPLAVLSCYGNIVEYWRIDRDY
jgi:hypothetical protein